MQQLVKIELSCRRELNFYVLWWCVQTKLWKNLCQHIFAKLSSRLHESSILTSCCIIRYGLSITVLVCHLRVLQLSIEFGGVLRPKTLRTAPRRRIVMVNAPKKIGGSSKKNVRQLNGDFAFDQLSLMMFCLSFFQKISFVCFKKPWTQ